MFLKQDIEVDMKCNFRNYSRWDEPQQIIQEDNHISFSISKHLKKGTCLQLSQPLPFALRHFKSSEGTLEVRTVIFGWTAAGSITTVTLRVLISIL